MNRMFITIALSIGFANLALAGVKVTSLNLKTEGPTGFVNVSVSGRSNELPDMKVYKNVIEISLHQAEAFETISKTVSGATLTANMLNGKALVKAVLPYDVSAEEVSLNWKNGGIEVSFPRNVAAPVVARNQNGVSPLETRPVKTKKSKQVVEVKNEKTVSKDSLNEEYLNKLMIDDQVVSPTLASAKTEKMKLKKDEIKVEQAGLKKISSPTIDGFSMTGYAAKFTVFLALVLGLFYGIVQLLKKGVFSRGKMGFLNNSQMIQVLSTTYISPKRSLMIVKAHKQIFLVANSETGLAFLSEMTDTSGLIKEGEKLVTGSNFDINFQTADSAPEENESSIKLKEDILESTPFIEEKGLSKFAVAKDIVKFSDELKKKAKKLKPIEFN